MSLSLLHLLQILQHYDNQVLLKHIYLTIKHVRYISDIYVQVSGYIQLFLFISNSIIKVILLHFLRYYSLAGKNR
jgi:hypothetical protein